MDFAASVCEGGGCDGTEREIVNVLGAGVGIMAYWIGLSDGDEGCDGEGWAWRVEGSEV
ncbi:hypothetical protein DPMN_081692 [Dreissena polymorpha]|uniref:Uncharacterized protein n=1 Tax=Dreissena polymorpha TaxID=45954 RepID=A0A9D4BGJ8_DREPO|nr:hypothetical protein DPMN_081692 [Dreissena polymorpha]